MMRRFAGAVAVGLAVVLAGAARADDSARSVIDQAIKARGGESHAKAVQIKTKGEFFGFGDMGIPYTAEITTQWPDKQKTAVEAELNGQKLQIVTTVVGDKAWRRQGDDTVEMSKEQAAEQKEGLYAEWLGTLAPLAQGGDFKLTPIGDKKIDNHSTVGVAVTSPNHKEVKLYFDRDTHLLIASERKVTDERSGDEVVQEVLYSDYKDFHGLKHFAKMTIKRGGKKFVEAQITDVKPLQNIDAAVFKAES